MLDKLFIFLFSQKSKCDFFPMATQLFFSNCFPFSIVEKKKKKKLMSCTVTSVLFPLVVLHWNLKSLSLCGYIKSIIYCKPKKKKIALVLTVRTNVFLSFLINNKNKNKLCLYILILIQCCYNFPNYIMIAITLDIWSKCTPIILFTKEFCKFKQIILLIILEIEIVYKVLFSF